MTWQKNTMILPQTVIGYLVKHVQAGHAIPNPERFLSLTHVSPSVRKQVMKAFDDHGSEFLKPVFSQMNETVDYNELRVLRLYYLCTHSQPNGGN